MKHIIRNVKTQHVIAFALLLIIAFAIWFEGPLLTFNNQQPLLPASKRIYLIMTIFVLVGFIHWLLMPQEKSSNLPSTSPTPESKNKIQLLKGRFIGAIQFLKKTSISRQGKMTSLASLPWFLVIGPNQAGKTTLLANATVNYILTKQFKQEKILSSDSCDWWATRDLVLVDIPGSYLKEQDQFLWNHFIHLIKKHRGHHGVNAVVLALPFPELIKKQNLKQKKQLVADIKTKILQLHQQFSDQITVYLVITKCDLLPGFADFFGNCSAEELTQPWGITLPTLKNQENLYDTFIVRFNALIKKLNTQLITRLHNERNALARPAIKDFPLQMERLKETTYNFLRALALPELRLHGVYLTSAAQLNEDAKPAEAQLINPASHQALQLLKAPLTPSKGYFIRQMIQQGLLSSANQAQPIVEKEWKRRTTYAISATFFVAALILLGRDFQHSLFLTYAIQNDLAQYQLSLQHSDQDNDHFLKTLPLLNSLQTRALRNNTKLSQLAHVLSYYSDKSQKTATAVYTQALQAIILPEIKNVLETYLKSANNANPALLYAALKAYLMLGDPATLQADYVVKTLQQLIATPMDHQTIKSLISHTNAAFAATKTGLTLDPALINETRSQLYNLPKLDLGLVILRNMNNENAKNIIDATDSTIFTNQNAAITPAIFTGALIPVILTEELPIAANEALQGNNVLGKPEILSSEATISAFPQQLRSHYIATYISVWENKLLHTQLTTPTSLSHIDAMISSITGTTSPLLALLKNIQQNTSFAPILTASPTLSALNNLLANAHSEQTSTLYNVFVSLRKLHFNLEKILTSQELGNAAFEAAKNRTLNAENDAITQIHLLAEQNTEPMKSWLNNLATQSWYFVLTEASRYIETQWQINIVTIYHAQITNHYPFDPASSQELDMQQFLNFAGKQGTLANFYQRFLQPFVIDNANQWQWRTIDNQKLPFAPEILSQIQQALKVQNVSKYALFSQGQANPALLKFHLPENLTEKS
jgi:type VI secretion system protein ImpL